MVTYRKLAVAVVTAIGISFAAAYGVGMLQQGGDQPQESQPQESVTSPPRGESVMEPSAPVILPAPPQVAEPQSVPPLPEPGPMMPPLPQDSATAAPPLATVAPQPPVLGEVPDWQRFAVAGLGGGTLPMVAIVIDDLGVDRRRTQRAIELPGPLTTSFLAYARELPRQTAAARARGHELMVHVPMEPLGPYKDPGPHVLAVGQSVDEQRTRLRFDLSRFTHFVGINNHMGSKFTADAGGMRVVMEELRYRGLLYLDSVTTDRSVGPELAKAYGVPYAERDVFLDNDLDAARIRRQLGRLEAIARRRGYAIAIGHPHDSTIQVLAEWLPGLREKGLALVPVSAIVRRRFPTG